MSEPIDIPSPALAVLSEGQLEALTNLSRKAAGQTVDWISISHARALTDLGLASRGAEGWNITAAGVMALAGHTRTKG